MFQRRLNGREKGSAGYKYLDSGTLHVIKEDADDDVILETAVENNVEIIVSGDNHLLKLKQFNEVRILTATGFLETL